MISFEERDKVLLFFYSMSLIRAPSFSVIGLYYFSGPSGVGKTLTAEGVSEMKKIPLYNVRHSLNRSFSRLISIDLRGRPGS